MSYQMVGSPPYRLEAIRISIEVRIKSVQELVDWMSGRLDVVEVPWSQLDSCERAMHEANARILTGKPEGNFRCFRLLPTERNMRHFDGAFRKEGLPERAYVVFEESVGCLYSSIGKLFLELKIERGFSMEDEADNTVVFQDYLASVRHLTLGEY